MSLRSTLHAEHAALGARFTDFGGWEMPLQYQGVLAEHRAVREGVGVFDVSHLGRFSLEGPGTTDVLRRLLCNDISQVAPGRAQYSMVLNQQGGVEDDVIVWRWAEDAAWVLPNGANYDKITGMFRTAAATGVTVSPMREQTALLAVQGPESAAVLQSVLGDAPKRFRLLDATFDASGTGGATVRAAGTGYTGEKGGELAVPNDVAPAVWRALLQAGATPCGLGSRDTLRLEMGYPLWGQDLDPGTTPIEAGLEWVVDWDHDFVGREALLAQKEGGVPKRLVGFVMEGRAIARHGYAARASASTGIVASGNFSPTLGKAIGLAFLAPPPDDAGLEVEVRGVWEPARRVDPPFLVRA